MEKCYYFLYQKHNLIILLKVNDFTKAWFLQGREWYSGKWMIISNCEHSFVYLVKWHFLNKQSTSTINSVGDILLRWRHSNEHLNFLTLSIFLAIRTFNQMLHFKCRLHSWISPFNYLGGGWWPWHNKMEQKHPC